MSDMYSEYQTEKTRFSLNNLQDRSDSIFNELQQAEKKLARVKDRNTRVITSSGRLDEIKYMREVKVLNTCSVFRTFEKSRDFEDDFIGGHSNYSGC